MRAMRKICSLVLCLAFAVGFFPAGVQPAWAEDNVSYIDENGDTKTCENATVVTASDTTWGNADSDTWYVASSEITINHTVTVSGNVNLILADGATLSVSAGESELHGISIDQGASLTVYGQTECTGVLTTKGGSAPEEWGGISYGSGVYGYNGSLTLIGITLESDSVNTSSGTLKALKGATIDVDVKDRFHSGISIGTFEVVDSNVDVLISDNISSSNAAIDGSSSAKLIVRGTSSVTAKAPEEGIVLHDLEVYDGTVTATCTDCNYASGAIRAYNVKVEGGELRANATGTGSTVSAFYMGGLGNFSVSGGTVEATASGNSSVYAINGTNTTVEISGGTTTLSATAQTGNATGMWVDNFTITGGIVSASGSGQASSYGIFASDYDPPISGGTITATGNGVAIFTQEGVAGPDIRPAISSAFSHVTYANTSASSDGATIVDESAETFQWPNYKYIQIEPKKSQENAPSAPELETASTNSVTLKNNESTGGTGKIQYAYTTGGETSVPESRWQDETTFSELAAGTKYVFYARYAGDATTAPSSPSSGTVIYTLPAITTTSLPDGTVGQTYTTTLAATSAESVTWSATGLPAGLSLNASTGEISGTPTEAITNRSVTITATVGSGETTASNSVSLTITIEQGTPAITANAYHGEQQTDAFIYGETITIRGNITASSNGTNTLTEPEQNQVGLYVSGNENPIATAAVSNGSFTLNYDTSGKAITPSDGTQTLTVRYGGSTSLNSGETTVSITLNKKNVTVALSGTTTKVYDGNTTVPDDLTLSLNDVLEGDKVTASATNIVYDSAAVGDNKTIMASGIALAGDDVAYYSLSNDTAIITGSITKATPTLTLSADPSSFTGGGSVTLTLTGVPEGETASLSCDNEAVIIRDGEAANTWTATLPNSTATYIFTATTSGSGNYDAGVATTTVSVTSYVPPSTPSTPTTPSKPEQPSGPSTGDSDGWESILDEILDAEDGDTITIDMNGETEVPGEIFEAVADRDVTVIFEMGEDVSWTVNGNDVPKDTSFDTLNLGVNMNTNGIPIDVINAITGEVGTVQVTLEHDGAFGFVLTLSAPLGEENAGYWANLYHYNEADEEMDFETASLIADDGTVRLRLTHASQYAIVIDDHSHAPLPFVDVSADDWFYDPVVWAYNEGLMTGTSATTFEPNTSTTRGMIVAILHRLEGGPMANSGSFIDVTSGDWYADAVNWAASVGIVAGFEDGSFRPNDAITREQMAAILCNYAQWKGMDTSARADLSGYSDQPSAWAQDVMGWAVGEGLISGTSATTLDPQAATTRAQTAAIFQRFLTAES